MSHNQCGLCEERRSVEPLLFAGADYIRTGAQLVLCGVCYIVVQYFSSMPLDCGSRAVDVWRTPSRLTGARHDHKTEDCFEGKESLLVTVFSVY